MKKYFPITVSIITTLLLYSCNQEYYPVGENLLSDQMLQTESESFPAFTFQESISEIESSNQPLIQLGVINHPVFGRAEASIVTQVIVGSDPIFGDLSQRFEDLDDESDPSLINEEETVKQAYLEIPFFTSTKDTDNDGVIDSFDADPNDPESNSDGDELTDLAETQAGLNPLSADSDGDGILDHNDTDNASYDAENKVFSIDSIYGNRETQFNLQVHELTYYLGNLDPNSNFESEQAYYSNRDYYEEGFVGATLLDETVQLNFDELRFNYTEDDPETTDVDETTLIETRLTPRIRVPLDTSFFQERLLDIEGSGALSGNTAYQKEMRGFIIRVNNLSDDLYMLLNFQSAVIKIEYEFNDYNTQGTLTDTSDDTIEKVMRTFNLRLGGTQVNILKNESFNTAIQQRITASQNNIPTDKLFIQSSRLHGKIRLFSEDSPEENELLDNIRTKTWLINEANLIFYIDPETTTPEELIAQRLYLFNYKTGDPIADYTNDGSTTTSSGQNTNKQIFGGILELDESNKPFRYRFNVTRHLTNIIRNDSINSDLGLVVTANIDNPNALKARSDEALELLNYPQAATLNPLGVVVVGSSPDSTLIDKKVELELIYSEY